MGANGLDRHFRRNLKGFLVSGQGDSGSRGADPVEGGDLVPQDTPQLARAADTPF